MHAVAAPTKSERKLSIRWPEEFNPEEGWEILGKALLLPTDTRTLSSVYSAIRSNGAQPSALIERLGGPKARKLDRTIAQCHKEIRTHYKKTGERPTCRTSKEFGSWDRWLCRQGSSLSKECDKLGLTSTRNLDRSLAQCHKEILTHYKKTGKRPTESTSKAFRNWQLWLYYQGSSLSKECDKLRLPSLLNLDRSLSQCHKEILTHYKKTGKRPTVSTSKVFTNWNLWLGHRGSSLSKECDKLGLPSPYNLGRTIEQCHKEILAYYERTGERPTERTSKEFKNWSNWLSRRGSTLSQECNKLGLPPAK